MGYREKTSSGRRPCRAGAPPPLLFGAIRSSSPRPKRGSTHRKATGGPEEAPARKGAASRGGAQRPAPAAGGGKTAIFLLAVNRADGGHQMAPDHRRKQPDLPQAKLVVPVAGNRRTLRLDDDRLRHALLLRLQRRKVLGAQHPEEYGAFGLNHGYASTPLLHRGRLYIQVLHGMKTDDPSYVFAVEAKTGKTVWKVERPTDADFESPDDYSTPIVVRVKGKEQLVVSGGDYVTGHDLGSGHELWRMGGFNPDRQRAYRTIASSINIGDTVYTSSNPRQPLYRLQGRRRRLDHRHGRGLGEQTRSGCPDAHNGRQQHLRDQRQRRPVRARLPNRRDRHRPQAPGAPASTAPRRCWRTARYTR